MTWLQAGESYLAPYRREERSCSNCRYQERCFTGEPKINDHQVVEAMIAHWRLRSGWLPDRYNNYIKIVMGGLCGNFEHYDAVIRARAKANQFKKEGQPEWEE